MLTLLILLLIKHGTNAFLFVALLATRHGGFVSLRWLVVSRKRYFKGDVDRSISRRRVDGVYSTYREKFTAKIVRLDQFGGEK